MSGVKDHVDSSDLDRRITIQAPITDTDSATIAQGGGYGPNPANYNDVYACWANMQNFPHGRGLIRAYKFAQLYPEATLVIQIWFQKTVLLDATMRVKYVAHGVTHFYQILGVQNPMEANVSLFLICQEWQAKSPN
jgi:hypothetical protein